MIYTKNTDFLIQLNTFTHTSLYINIIKYKHNKKSILTIKYNHVSLYGNISNLTAGLNSFLCYLMYVCLFVCLCFAGIDTDRVSRIGSISN